MNHIIFKEIERLLEAKEKIIVAIDGRSASGKSSLGKLLFERYDVNLFHMDDFFLPAKQKTVARLEEPGGNVDYTRFKEEVMDNLKKDEPFNYEIFDCKVQTLTEKRTILPKKLNIVEGSYSMHPILIENYDLKIFLDIDDDIQRKRIISRNGKEMYKRFSNEWIPLENKYFNEFDIRGRADIAIVVKR